MSLTYLGVTQHPIESVNITRSFVVMLNTCCFFCNQFKPFLKKICTKKDLKILRAKKGCHLISYLHGYNSK